MCAELVRQKKIKPRSCNLWVWDDNDPDLDIVRNRLQYDRRFKINQKEKCEKNKKKLDKHKK